MASFLNNSLKQLEEKMKNYEVDIPLHPEFKIDEGSAAILFKHSFNKKQVAVKQMKQHLSRVKVLKTAGKLKELNHDNVVQFLGYCFRPSSFIFDYCCIELQEDFANNLSQLISIFNANQHYVFIERLDYIIQASGGLLYLHSNGIVHRDFKPSNILVTGTLKDIKIKVADFDDFVEFKQTMMTSATINFLQGMTLAYTAPELCTGEVKTPSTKTDVYSWGISVFEILCHLPSAWSNVIPILNDNLLLSAVKENRRPDINELQNLYNSSEDNRIGMLLEFIATSWNSKQEERPFLQQVCNV